MKKAGSAFLPIFIDGRGSRRTPDRHDRLIPMINVVFLLLTFFMVAGTIRANDIFGIKPPEAAAVASLPKSEWVLAVNKAGAIALNDEEMPFIDAITRLKKEQQEKADLYLQLKADGNVEAHIILPLFKKLADLGLKHLDLVVVRKRGA